MSRTDELRKINASMKKDADSAIEQLRAASNYAKRMSNVFDQAGDIMAEPVQTGARRKQTRALRPRLCFLLRFPDFPNLFFQFNQYFVRRCSDKN